ncbi:hypothetical protein DFH09DRAFT_454248 [Mycena vulgaris]|nr:hypothetical protein DFH09DRAFT_454248 [Mycena vulgaris]
MIRVSLLGTRAFLPGTGLYPARVARLTPIKSICRTVSNPPGDGTKEHLPRTSDTSRAVPSAVTPQPRPVAGTATSPRVKNRRRQKSNPRKPKPPIPNPVSFQLPDAVPMRSYVPSHFVRHQQGGYSAGKPWRNLPLRMIHPKIVKHGQRLLAGEAPFYDDSFGDLDLGLLFDITRSKQIGVDRVAWRRDLLRILGNTQHHEQGWKAYNTLVSVPFSIPHRHLKRLVRLLARETTKTRGMFIRLLSVLSSIQQSGWQINAFQWNALIDNAGKGLRKIPVTGFKTAFDAYIDMLSGKPVGSSLDSSRSQSYGIDEEIIDNPRPNIVTYTMLLSIAADTRNRAALEVATSVLKDSAISPNRITHLSVLKYYSKIGHLNGVRASLSKMHQQGLELGLDGLHACMSAFSRADRVDVPTKIYRILRHNKTPEVHIGPDSVDSARRSLLEEGIEIADSMVPNEVTYTTIVQIMAHHGNLNAALTAFMDMLSADNVEIGAPLYRDEHGKLKPSPYSPTVPIFRGLFHGFSRHGVPNAPPSITGKSQPWGLESLGSLFEVFLQLPEYIEPATSMIYWILISFDKTSNHDRELLRAVWKRMEDRFQGGQWGGYDHRLQRIRRSLFDPTAPEFDKDITEV